MHSEGLFKNKIVPVGSLYFVYLVLFSQDLQPNLLNLYSSATFPDLKNSEKRCRSSWVKKSHCDTSRGICKSSSVCLASPHSIKLRKVIQHWMMQPLEMTFWKIFPFFPTLLIFKKLYGYLRFLVLIFSFHLNLCSESLSWFLLQF